MICPDCGGTRLAPSVGGAERGSCHCLRGPGAIVAHLMYGTEQGPGGSARYYEVEWLDGEIVKVDPPTLERADAVLTSLRSDWLATQLGEALK
jgi:hypothetical protein